MSEVRKSEPTKPEPTKPEPTKPPVSKKNLINTKKVFVAPKQPSIPKLDERKEYPTTFKDKSPRKVGVNNNQIKTKNGYIHRDILDANAELKIKEKSKTKGTVHPDIKTVKYAWGEFVNKKK